MAEWSIMLKDRVVQSFFIEDGDTKVIGRGTDADVVVDNTAISRHHASLEFRGGIYLLADLKSLNGTFVNGKKIEGIVPVTEGDAIQLGKFRLVAAAGFSSSLPAAALSMSDSDATVFVGQGKPVKESEAAKGTVSGSKHSLILTAGSAVPQKIVLDGKGSVKIGKNSDCDLQVPGWLVAGVQCYITNKGEKYFISVKWSWRGTFLNGIKIKGEHRLRKGDIIEIAKVCLRFE